MPPADLGRRRRELVVTSGRRERSSFGPTTPQHRARDLGASVDVTEAGSRTDRIICPADCDDFGPPNTKFPARSTPCGWLALRIYDGPISDSVMR